MGGCPWTNFLTAEIVSCTQKLYFEIRRISFSGGERQKIMDNKLENKPESKPKPPSPKTDPRTGLPADVNAALRIDHEPVVLNTVSAFNSNTLLDPGGLGLNPRSSAFLPNNLEQTPSEYSYSTNHSDPGYMTTPSSGSYHGHGGNQFPSSNNQVNAAGFGSNNSSYGNRTQFSKGGPPYGNTPGGSSYGTGSTPGVSSFGNTPGGNSSFGGTPMSYDSGVPQTPATPQTPMPPGMNNMKNDFPSTNNGNNRNRGSRNPHERPRRDSYNERERRDSYNSYNRDNRETNSYNRDRTKDNEYNRRKNNDWNRDRRDGRDRDRNRRDWKNERDNWNSNERTDSWNNERDTRNNERDTWNSERNDWSRDRDRNRHRDNRGDRDRNRNDYRDNRDNREEPSTPSFRNKPVLEQTPAYLPPLPQNEVLTPVFTSPSPKPPVPPVISPPPQIPLQLPAKDTKEEEEPRSMSLDSRIQSLLSGFKSPEPAKPKSPPPVKQSSTDIYGQSPHNGSNSQMYDPNPQIMAVNGSGYQEASVPVTQQDDDDRMSLDSTGSAGEPGAIEVNPADTSVPPPPLIPTQMVSSAGQVQNWQQQNDIGSNYMPGYMNNYPAAQFNQNFVNQFNNDLNNQIFESLKPKTDPKEEADKHEVTFSEVLENFVTELKDIMAKDLGKKMVETSAFKSYDQWWDREENKTKVGTSYIMYLLFLSVIFLV